MTNRFGLGVILGTVMLLGASASAATFTANSGAGSSTIGSGGDYATLAAAAADFNGAQPVTGNYTFFVLGDLTEAANVAFGKNTNGFTVTLKPAPTVTPTITFNGLANGTDMNGNLVIGANALANIATDLVPTNNFVIDGSNTVGGTTRDMTLTNAAVTYNISRVVSIIGNSDNVVVKNCNIINNATAGTSPGALAVIKRFDGTNNLLPDGFLIQNNLIRSIAALNGNGLDFNRSGAPTVAVNDWVVTGNTIEARQRGINIVASINGTMSNNTVHVGLGGSNASLLSHGLFVQNGGGVANQTFNFTRNRVKVQTNNEVTGNFGAVGLALVSTAGTGNVVNMNNNMIHIESTVASSTNAMRLCGTDLVSAVTFNVYHNSILVSATGTLTNQVPNTGGASITNGVHGLGTHRASLAAIVNSANNIFHCNIAGGAAVNRMSTAGTLASNFNNLSNSGGHTGAIGATVHTTLSAWRTASSNDANSFAVNPLTTTNSAWAPSGVANLNFVPTSAKPLQMVGVSPVGGVTTDIDGETRSAVAGQVYPGADENPAQPLPVAVSAFTID